MNINNACNVPVRAALSVLRKACDIVFQSLWQNDGRFNHSIISSFTSIFDCCLYKLAVGLSLSSFIITNNP